MSTQFQSVYDNPFGNRIINSDSYKVSHFRQYPPGTTKVYSYLESRGSDLAQTTTFMGLQYILKRYFTKPITKEEVAYAAKRFALHFGDDTMFNHDMWNHIVEDHGGKLPLEIHAVPEGMSVPTRNVLMTVTNTCEKCFSLTNYFETILMQVWYPITVATLSRKIKKLIHRYLEKTGDVAGLGFKLHDFGFRGGSSVESAAIGDAAHLVNFMGTDTTVGFELAYLFYGEEMAGFSIPAAEHSTITSWGKENEVEAFRNMIRQYGNTKSGLYAVVSDSYDIFNACRNLWGGELRDEVLNAKNILVVRPDSGDPVTVVTQVVETLGEKFGYTVNEKGYRVLNHVRVIQGDGINYDSIRGILESLEVRKWSADNIAFGMGGALLQQVNRDTMKFAFKASFVTINGENHDVFKSPIGESYKKSKAGMLALVKDELGAFTTIQNLTPDTMPKGDELICVYKDGELLVDHTFAEVRERAAIE